jgi:hypothetical protein
MRKDWTGAEVKRLQTMADQKYSMKEAALDLGRSWKSVRQCAYRHKIRFHSSRWVYNSYAMRTYYRRKAGREATRRWRARRKEAAD